MADIKWIKIVTDVFDDEKILLIESMPDHDAIIVIWFKLLCLAGKNNNKGVFVLNERIAYTDEMLSTIFRRPINTVRLALKTFEQYGMVELINGVITIPNWSKHQTLDQIESRREYQKEYMASKRKEQKVLALCEPNCKPNSKANCKVNVSPIEVDKNKNKKENKIRNIYTPEFELFWSAYPELGHQNSKLQSAKNFDRICKKISAGSIIQAAKNYAADCENEGKTEFIYKASNFVGKAEYYKSYVDGIWIPSKKQQYKKQPFQPQSQMDMIKNLLGRYGDDSETSAEDTSTIDISVSK